MRAIYKRELSAYFSSSIGFVYLSVFYFFSGLFFYIILLSNTADLTPVFTSMFTIVLMLIPILTMKLLSEDKKQKTDQALLTAPIGLTGIVLGKYLAALTVYSIGLLINVAFGFILSGFASPEWLVIIGNILGMLFLGSALIAVGTFISSLTESQVIAAVSTFAISLVLLLLDSIIGQIPVPFLNEIAGWISFNARFVPFSMGIINYANIVFFISVAAVFVFLTTRILDRRRWS